jgi:hypothetical protein
MAISAVNLFWLAEPHDLQGILTPMVGTKPLLGPQTGDIYSAGALTSKVKFQLTSVSRDIWVLGLLEFVSLPLHSAPECRRV